MHRCIPQRSVRSGLFPVKEYHMKQKCINFKSARGILIVALSLAGAPDIQAENLVPTAPGTSPNYFSTWNAQYYQVGIGVANFDCTIMEGGEGNQRAQDCIKESTVFGPNGWSKSFYPKARADLYFMFDDGAFAGGSDNSFMLDVGRFPSFAGGTYQDQWKKVNDSLKASGWRSLAIWCRDPANNPQPVQWCKFAGVDYWKIDGGDEDLSQEALRASSNYPQLKMEHMPNYSNPLNGDWGTNGRFGAQTWGAGGTVGLIRKCDIVRTYDIISAFSAVTTIDRVSELLKAVGGHTEVTCLLNVEDEVYIAAGLGCLMGVMRHPMNGCITPDCDVGFMIKPGSRQLKKRMDEVTRAVRWQRIAPAFGAGLYATTLDANALIDSWHFLPGETWLSEVINNAAYQGASARVARGIALPIVTGTAASQDSLPFVLTSKYPNGAVSIATIGRCKPSNCWFSPRADIILDAGAATGPIGIFGYYKSLRINFAQLPKDPRIKAQDLAGDVAVDITGRVTITSTSIAIPGSVIAEIGLAAATAGDLSDPGMVLAIQSATGLAPFPSRRTPAALTNQRLAIIGRAPRVPAGIKDGPSEIDFIDIRGRRVAPIDRLANGEIADGVYMTCCKGVSHEAGAH